MADDKGCATSWADHSMDAHDERRSLHSEIQNNDDVVHPEAVFVSDSQGAFTLVSLLPIVPAFLSLCGSTCIIMSIRRKRNVAGSTGSIRIGPYERILTMMSYYDILFTLTVVCSPFFGTPQDRFYFQKQSDASRSWTIPDVASPLSCRIMGTMLQLSLSNILYFGMLSFYFLMTIRLHVSLDQFSKKYERYMHAFCILWPLITSIVGFIVNWYDGLHSFPGCWIDNYPKGATGSDAKADDIAWICSGSVTFATIISLLVNYCVIAWYVTRQYGSRNNNNSSRYYDNSTTQFGQQQPVSSRQRLSNLVSTSIRRFSFDSPNIEIEGDDNVTEVIAGRTRSNSNDDMPTRSSYRQESTGNFSGALHSIGQNHRVRLVSTQASLYVFSFFVTYTWFIALQIIESLSLVRELPMVHYMIILQAIFTPLAGFWNALIYFRPIYIQLRQRQSSRNSNHATVPFTRWQSIIYVVFGIQGSTTSNNANANDDNPMNTNSDRRVTPFLLRPVLNVLRRFTAIASVNSSSNSNGESKPYSSSGGGSESRQQQARSSVSSVVGVGDRASTVDHYDCQKTESLPGNSISSASASASAANPQRVISDAANGVDNHDLQNNSAESGGDSSSHSSWSSIVGHCLNQTHNGNEKFDI